MTPNARWSDTVWRLGLIGRNAVTLSNVLLARYLHLRPRYVPTVLAFITFRCNLRCRTCGVCDLQAEQGKAPELNLDEWKAVIRSAAKLRAAILVISGGEPMLRQDMLFDMIRCASEARLTTHLCTNGVLLNPENVARLAEARVDTVSVSIESPDKALHESIRGPNTFDRALNGIRLLCEAKPSIRVGINHVVTAENFRCMADMVPFAESLGVHQLKFAPIHTNLLHKRKELDRFGTLLFRKEDLPEFEREVDRLMRAVTRSRLLTTSPMFLSRMSELYTDPRRFRCFAGYAVCAIDPLGYVSPCSDMDGVRSVRQAPLEEIWRSRAFAESRANVHRCNAPCWDTVNAELSIRLRPKSLLADFARTWKDIGFYFGKQKP